MCVSSSLSLSVGFSIQDEARDVARSTPQGAHYHADSSYLLPLMRKLDDAGSFNTYYDSHLQTWFGHDITDEVPLQISV